MTTSIFLPAALLLGRGGCALGATIAPAPIDKDGYDALASAKRSEFSIVHLEKKERMLEIEVSLAGATPFESPPVVSFRPSNYWRWSGGGCSDGLIYYSPPSRRARRISGPKAA